MNLCILSGKGGTGKTSVAVNLSVLLQAQYFDCDVEEPNGFVFLNPSHITSKDVLVDYPKIDPEKCTLCGKCTRACQFNALANTKKSVMVFPTLCHGCHACEIACIPNAISFEQRSVGKVETGESHNNRCFQGIMNVGEHMAVPIIHDLLKKLDLTENNILDCAPGTSCNVVNTLKNSDAAIIVTEPTVFGLHDMSIAVDLLKQFDLPHGVVINKSRGDDAMIEEYCASNNIPILGAIPYAKSAAQAYSEGRMLSQVSEFRSSYHQLAEKTKEFFAWN